VIQTAKDIPGEPNRLDIADGTIEALKWTALILMTLDHYNKYIYNGTIPGLTEAGRLALPFFSFVFAYNLARPRISNKDVYQNVIKRLLLCALISTPVYIGLGVVRFGWWPLNILFSLLLAVVIIQLYESNSTAKWYFIAALFIIGGAVIEFMWPAIIITLSAWFYCQSKNPFALLMWFFGMISLFFINGNFYAILSFPFIFLLPKINIKFPRWKNAFYIYYPFHLSIIWLLLFNV